MPAYTIPAGSNYTITQFVRSRAIKSLAFMADAAEKLRDSPPPGGPIFNGPDFIYFTTVFYRMRRMTVSVVLQRLLRYLR